MAEYRVRGSDGNIHLVTGPDDARPDLLQHVVERNILAAGATGRIEEEPGDTSRGFGAVWPQTKALVGGTLGLIGNTMEEAGAPFGLGEGLRQYGMDVYQRNMEESQKGAKPTDDFVTAYEKFRNEGDLSGLVDSIQYWSGYGAGQALETVALAAAGSIAGGGLNPFAGAAAALEKGAAKGLITSAVEKLAGKMVAESSGKLAIDAARPLAARKLAAQVGSAAALYSNAATQELGSIYGEAQKEGPLTGKDLARVWGFGLSAAAVEAAADVLGIKQVTAAGQKIPIRALLLHGAKEVGIGAGREGVTEAIQTGLERAGAEQPLTGDEALRDYINSVVAGAIGGGQAGALAGVTHALRRGETEPPPGTTPPAPGATPPASGTAPQPLGPNATDDEILAALRQFEEPTAAVPDRWADVPFPTGVDFNTPEGQRAFDEYTAKVGERRAALQQQAAERVAPPAIGTEGRRMGLTPEEVQAINTPTQPSRRMGITPAEALERVRQKEERDRAPLGGNRLALGNRPAAPAPAAPVVSAPAAPTPVAPAPAAPVFTPETIAQRINNALEGVPKRNATVQTFANRVKTELPKLLGNAGATTQFLNELERATKNPRQTEETQVGRQVAFDTARQIVAEHAQQQTQRAAEAARARQQPAAAPVTAEPRSLRAPTSAELMRQRNVTEQTQEQEQQDIIQRYLAHQQQLDEMNKERAARQQSQQETAAQLESQIRERQPKGAPRQPKPARRSVGTAENTTGHDQATLTSRVADMLGPQVAGRLMGSGKLRVINSRQAQPHVGAAVADTRGFYNPTDDTTYLVADNIPTTFTDMQLHGLLLHELGVHALTLGRNSKGWKSILDQIARMLKSGNPAVVAAHEMAMKAGAVPEDILEETAGYLVETAPKSSIARRIITWFKDAIYRLTGLQMKLTDADIAAMAASALKRATEPGRGGPAGGILRGGRAPVWKSVLKEQILTAGRKVARSGTATGKEWNAWLAGAGPGLGIKAEELQWTGITDFLRMLDKVRISPEDLARWVDENGVKVDETVLGAPEGATPTARAFNELNERLKNEYPYYEPGAEPTQFATELPPGWVVSDEYDAQTQETSWVLDAPDGSHVLEHMPEYIENRAQATAYALDWYNTQHFGTPDNTTINWDRVPPELAEEHSRLLDAWIDENERGLTDTRYEGYTLPGAKAEYRELLLTLPTPKGAVTEADLDAAYKRMREAEIKYSDLYDDVGKIERHLNDVENLGKRYIKIAKEQNASEEALDIIRDQIAEQRDALLKKFDALQAEVAAAADVYQEAFDEHEKIAEQRKEIEKSTFRHSHWDVANPVAHVRFNARRDGEGRRILFIEEVQSDWAQAGRERSFGIVSEQESGRRWRHYNDLQHEATRLLMGTGAYGLDELGDMVESELVLALQAYGHGTVATELREAARALNEADAVPPAPYVSKTESWTDLVLKRVIRYAVDNGFDGVAWTTGEQQHKRFPVSQKGESTEKGMKGYYDKILPTRVKEVTRKLGGAEMTQFNLPVGHLRVDPEGVELQTNYRVGLSVPDEGGPNIWALWERGTAIGRYPTQEEANAALQQQLALIASRHRGQPGFLISDKMRELASKPLPLFSRSPLRASRILQSNAAAFATPEITPRASTVGAARTVFNQLGRAANEALNNAGSFQNQVNAVDQVARGSWNFGKKLIYGAMPSHAITEMAQRYLPSAKRFDTLVRAHAGDMSAIHEQVGELVKRFNDWEKQAPAAEVAALNDVVFGGTEARVDLRKERVAYANDKDKLAEYDRLKVIFEDKLSEGGRNIYRQMRATYDRLFADIVQQVENTIKSVSGDRELATSLHKEFYARLLEKGNLEGYAPMRREGDHILIYEMTDSGERYFELYENERERDIRAAEVKQHPAYKQGSLRTPVKFDTKIFRDAPSMGFVGRVMRTLDAHKVDPKTSEAIMRIAIDMSPQSSMVRMLQHRKETPGYRRDAIWAFSKAAIGMRRRTINLKYAAEFGALSRDLEKDSATAYEGPNARTAQLLRNELEQRIHFAISPNLPRWHHIAKTLTYGWTLGFNVSSALIDAAAVPMVFYPILKSRYPNMSPAAAFSKATKLYLASGRSHKVETFLTAGLEEGSAELTEAQKAAGLAGRDVEDVRAWYSIANYDFSDPNLSAEARELRPLVEAAKRMGQIQRMSRFDDLESIGQGEVLNRVNAWQGVLMQGSERFRREVGMVAAYNMELENRRNKQGGLTEQDYKEAAERAIDFVEETSGGTSALASPRFSHLPIGGILFMYKRYGMTMYYLQAKMLRDMLKGETPEIRKAARAMAWRTMAMTALFAGVNGMPMMGVVAAIYNMFKDDEDDDWNTMMRKQLNPVLFEGIINYGLNTEVSSRIGLTNMVWRSDPANQDKAPAEVIASSLGGPAWGTIDRIIRGVGLAEQGHLQRALESWTPAAAANILKSIRYATEGTQTLKGDVITGEVSPWNVLMQGIGFAPADYLRAQEQVSFQKRLDKTASERRNGLLEKLYTASRTGDHDEVRSLMDDVREFNKEHPEHPIGGQTLRRSFKQRAKASANMIYGRLPDAKRRDLWREAFREMDADWEDDFSSDEEWE